MTIDIVIYFEIPESCYFILRSRITYTTPKKLMKKQVKKKYKYKAIKQKEQSKLKIQKIRLSHEITYFRSI